MSGSEAQTYSVLSERELQIVELVASGLTNQDIANTLEISKRTVDNHISNILQKTGTGNRVALFRWALNWGKICIDEVNCCKLPEFKPSAGNGLGDNVQPSDPRDTDTPISPAHSTVAINSMKKGVNKGAKTPGDQGYSQAS